MWSFSDEWPHYAEDTSAKVLLVLPSIFSAVFCLPLLLKFHRAGIGKSDLFLRQIRQLLFADSLWTLMKIMIDGVLNAWWSHHVPSENSCQLVKTLFYIPADLGRFVSAMTEVHMMVCFALATFRRSSTFQAVGRLLPWLWVFGLVFEGMTIAMFFRETDEEPCVATHFYCGVNSGTTSVCNIYLTFSFVAILAGYLIGLAAAWRNTVKMAAWRRVLLYPLTFVLSFGLTTTVGWVMTPWIGVTLISAKNIPMTGMIAVALEALLGFFNVSAYYLQCLAAQKAFMRRRVGLGLESWNSNNSYKGPVDFDLHALRHGSRHWARDFTNPFRELTSPLSDRSALASVAAYVGGVDFLPSVSEEHNPRQLRSARNALETDTVHTALNVSSNGSGPVTPGVSVLPSTVEQVFLPGTILGEGYFGRVRIVQARASLGSLLAGRQYALKILDQRFYKEQDLQHMAYRERSILQNTDHPCIVRLFAAWKVHLPPQWLLVMELCEGGSLQEQIELRFCALEQRSVFPQQLIVKSAAEMLMGLEYLHNKGIVHRDLKADNVLLTKYNHCKIADLGMARSMAGSGTLLPPAGHRPPELESSSCCVQADLYSWGILVFELQSGRQDQIEHAERMTPYGQTVDVTPHLVTFLEAMQVRLSGSVAVDLASTTELIRQTTSLEPSLRGTATELRNAQFFSRVDWNKLLRDCIVYA